MTISNISGSTAQASSSVNAKQSVGNKPDGGKKTVDDVLATLRELMPGWTISTSTTDWGDGFRNLQIDPEILQRMADDPKEMEKYKALILDLENVVQDLEKFGRDNPGQSFLFEISLDESGGITSMSIVKTILGTEQRSTFNLPADSFSWANFIRQRLEELNQGQVDDATGSKSWVT